MRTLFLNGVTLEDSELKRRDFLVENGVIAAQAPSLSAEGADRVLDLKGLCVFPGFVDVHVHLREPGFSYKETIATGSMACAAGGYTTVCAMPNLDPVPDSLETLSLEEEAIRRDAVIRVLPYASITRGRLGRGEIVNMKALSNRVCGFSDDGTGIVTAETMEQAMRQCVSCGSILSAHCEDVSLIPKGAPIHDGAYARSHNLKGIPSESEWGPIQRDIELCRKTRCRYHVCHVSARESIELIRQAKEEGVNISCETAPHYLLLCEEDLKDEGRFKMNPPLRASADRDALATAFIDGTVDCLATDHAPHSAEEKARGLAGSAMGIVGIETAFPLIYTHFVRTGRMSLRALIDRISLTPRRRFQLDGGIQPGQRCEMAVFALDREYVIDPDAFYSKGRATPFAGWKVHGLWQMTVCGDRIIENRKGERLWK